MWIHALAQANTHSNFWESFMSRVDIVVPVAGCVVGIVAIIAVCSAKTIKANRVADLKRSMIERGMSADEIERVISAGENPDQ